MHTQLKMYAKTYTPNCILHYAKALGLDPINFQFSSLRKLLQATIPVVEYKRKLISCYVTILKYLHWKFQLFNFKWCYLRWASNRIFSSKHTFKFIPLRVRACVCVCVYALVSTLIFPGTSISCLLTTDDTIISVYKEYIFAVQYWLPHVV